MAVSKIVGYAVRYPLSNWKKILILGIIILMGSIVTVATLLGTKNFTLIFLLCVFGFLISFLVRGYQFRIIKSSLANVEELPEFNAWSDMFLNGIKLFIVDIVYLIPAFLILIILSRVLMPSITLILGIIIPDPSILPARAIVNLVGGIRPITGPDTWALIAFLYMIIIIPISLMAIATMANNSSKLSAAFRFHEILNKITDIGWKNFLSWYIMTGIIFLILFAIGNVIAKIFNVIHPIVGLMFQVLILIPYLYMYLYRSVGLFYMSK